ncbi:hypothetical protein K2Q02_01860 [Patescibacteria group bacterium]|nr:hypothetical protein [Patescibacteria group bacterium]
MEKYSREQITEIAKPDPSWMNFEEEVIYEKKVISLQEAVTTLYTVWDDIEDFERIPFIDYASALKEKSISDIPTERLQKIEEIYNSKFTDEEIVVPVFKCRDLKILLPEEYPDYIQTPDEVYITEDRNHRLTALALRILDGEEIGNIPVTVFYGTIVK